MNRFDQILYAFIYEPIQNRQIRFGDARHIAVFVAAGDHKISYQCAEFSFFRLSDEKE